MAGDCVALDEERRSRCRHAVHDQSVGDECSEALRPGAGAVMATRTCGFVFTTTGRPCANLVADGAPWCRAGHPSTPAAVGVRTDARQRRARSLATRRRAFAPRGRGPASRQPDTSRHRADPPGHGERGRRRGRPAGRDACSADGTTALALLGGPDASPAARAAVVQRFGRVGALLVLGYEERGRARHLVPRRTAHGRRREPTTPDGRRPPRDPGPGVLRPTRRARACTASCARSTRTRASPGTRRGRRPPLAARHLRRGGARRHGRRPPGLHARARPGHAPREAARRLARTPVPGVRWRLARPRRLRCRSEGPST